MLTSVILFTILFYSQNVLLRRCNNAFIHLYFLPPTSQKHDRYKHMYIRPVNILEIYMHTRCQYALVTMNLVISDVLHPPTILQLKFEKESREF